jgi:hypothetical protein
MEGGLLFCRSSGVGWIISDSTTQISRVWADRADIVTVVEAAISCGDWFVPMCTPMVSAANCKAYWDEPGGTSWFWTNQDFISHAAYAVGIYSSYVSRGFRPKVNSMYLRAFRCVSY